MSTETKHLWEHNHSYYCTEGCYFVGGREYHLVHAKHESWADFMDDWGDSDPDYNLLFRWDWVREDPADYAYEIAEDPSFEIPGDTLKLFFFLQRKAKPFSHHIAVKPEDEPAVREWLTAKAEHMRGIWAPLLDGAAA
ncbi:hypothetical protein [Mycetocola saprophilus]|uniref:hypothetical protein n=1 Tax=Mycetocola saprophilus TaxID=76636 RepID=UPI0004BF5E87|nr:hypothetical protein [Mycetocola saprophilus]